MDYFIPVAKKPTPVCVPMVSPASLTETQARDMKLGVAVIDAFWAAVEADARFSTEHESPLLRCILAALCVRDILRQIGRPDATIAKFGLLVRRTTGNPIRELVIGTPKAPVIPNGWNAHMVARLGDVVLDPSFGQTRRDWNSSPLATACIADSSQDHRDASKRLGYKVQAHYRYTHGVARYEVAYVKLHRRVDARTRDWREAPDANATRRQPLVTAAVDILRRSS